MKLKTAGIIPARYQSSRFPGKPLAMIQGKSMIRRVYEQSMKCPGLSDVWVATDDVRIADHVNEFGGKVIMTSTTHPSGTDRCAEALERTEGEFDAVINIQGDEPFIDPEQISLVCKLLHGPETQIATLGKKITSAEELFNPNIPKIAMGENNLAVYFSRHPIPYLRGTDQKDWMKKHAFFRHIGIYGYRSDVLKQIVRLPESSLEKAESLEQLRWLSNGYKIHVAETQVESHGVDVPEDIEKVIKLFIHG